MYTPDPFVGQNIKQYGTYGTEFDDNGNGKRFVKRRSNLVALMGALLVPFLIFTSVFAIRSFRLRYDDASIAQVLCFFLLLCVFLFGILAAGAVSNNGDARISSFMFATSLLGWVVAYYSGDYNYQYNMRPFYDISNLNTYPSVDPAKYQGSQLMDAGQIGFSDDTILDLKHSAGFMNKNTYCVAPIISSNASKMSAVESYDFWAVGINCCSAHLPDFHCGEYSDTHAHKGLRLLHEDQREYFRLAVQMAEASFNIRATHPIFLHWMVEPLAEINAYQDEGFSQFILAESLFLSWQLILVVILAMVLTKS